MRRTLLLLVLTLASTAVLAGISKAQAGDRVTFLRAFDDGLTYTVETPYGRERWRDRDLHYLALTGERGQVVKSLGREVQVYLPIMDRTYWFVVE